MVVLVLLGRFSIFSRMHTDMVPCSGFVKNPLKCYASDSMLPSFAIFFLSVMKKYHSSRCLVLLPLEVVPFSESALVVLVYVMVGTGTPCTARKCLVHSTWPIASSMATNSASVELFVLIFCLNDVEYVTPFLNVIIMLL